jgi:hypothetical protein
LFYGHPLDLRELADVPQRTGALAAMTIKF